MSAAADTHTVATLAQQVGGTVRGAGHTPIKGLNLLPDARPEDLTFVGDSRYVKQWAKSRAAAAVVSEKLAPMFDPRDERPLIIVPNADWAMLELIRSFAPVESLPDAGIHPTAHVHASAVLGARVRIGAHVSVDGGARIGDDVILFPGVRLYAGVEVGEKSVLHANVVVRQRCRIGRRVTVHQNSSIGADGFGYLPDPRGRGLAKVPHIGDVVLEDDVEIGANTCIDRAKFGSTTVGAGTKIDNLCQIGHNVRIGRHCALSGGVAIAGSVVIGNGVLIGGQAGVADHLHIGDGARIGAAAAVFKSVPAGETWTGYPADDMQATLRQWAAAKRLPELLRQLPRDKDRDQPQTQ